MNVLRPYRSYYIKTNYWSNLAAIHVLDSIGPFVKVFMFGNPNRVLKIKLCDITEIIPYLRDTSSRLEKEDILKENAKCRM